MSTAKLTLIERPKTRADWENNKLYYRQKSFSKSQLEIIEKNAKLEKEAMATIIKRSNGGGANAGLIGTCPNCPNYKHKNKKNKNAAAAILPYIEPPETKKDYIAIAILSPVKLPKIFPMDTSTLDNWEDIWCEEV